MRGNQEANLLTYLNVKNLAVVASAELEFGPGFICLTGETGAGKSLIVDALGALGGKKVSPDWIRTGEEKAIIEAVFSLEGERTTVADEDETAESFELIEDGELILRREISRRGRSRAFINGVMVPSKLLQDYASLVFEIHGQHGQQELLRERHHGALFDQHVGLAEAARHFERNRNHFLGSWKTYWNDVANEAEYRKELDYLRHQIQEIDRAKLCEEDDELEARLKLAENAEMIQLARQESVDLMDRTLIPDSRRLVGQLESLSEYDPELGPYTEQIKGFMVTLSELNHELSGLLFEELDERTLAALRRRQSELNELFLKFGSDRMAVLEERNRMVQRKDQLESSAGNLEQTWRDLCQRYEALRDEKASLDRRRLQLSEPFEKALTDVLAQLSFPHAAFKTKWDTPSWPVELPEVPDLKCPLSSLVFLFSPNAGEEPKALHKIASGGELSRVMLALIVSLKRSTAKTMVFDEVDAGLGGETAKLVGQKLAELGETSQVLCVTHLAQVAQFGAQHWLVEKRLENGRTLTDFRALDKESRTAELARLMGGDAMAPGLLQHARTMIDSKKSQHL